MHSEHEEGATPEGGGRPSGERELMYVFVVASASIIAHVQGTLVVAR